MSLRARILIVVLAAAAAPLALLGPWLPGATTRAAEEMLSKRLDEALARAAFEVGSRWIRVRADLLDAGPAAAVTAHDGGGAAMVVLELPPAASDPASRLRTRVPTQCLLSEPARAAAAAGTVLAAFDVEGTSLFALPFDPALLVDRRFRWGGDVWLTRRLELREPPLLLVAAAPLGPFTGPFRRAAGRGALVFASTALAAVALAAALTARMTRSIERLAAAAERVAAGELDVRLATGSDEVGRAAVAFNHMTENLRRTLRQLGEREALAAVGEFAAALAHEIRNPLTSIRIDLQLVEERLPRDSAVREIQSAALDSVRRLDATVHGALDVARSGRIQQSRIDLLKPLRAAVHAAAPELARRHAHLSQPPGDAAPLHVRGDESALERVFLNLLLNTTRAIAESGRVDIAAGEEDGDAVVRIGDDGPGIPPAVLPRVFEPFFTTRADGTGLGLAIAHRIVSAHGGRIRIDSSPGAGCAVEVRLPLAREAVTKRSPP
jgi:signal transduction histidine kinase